MLRASFTISTCNRYFEIFAHDLQGDGLGTLQNAEGGRIDPCCLAFQFGTASAAIEQLLGDRQPDFGRIERVILNANAAARGIVEPARAHRRFEIDARQEKPASLTQLELDRLTIFDRLSDLRVGFQSHCHRFLHRKSVRIGGKQNCTAHQSGGEQAQNT